LKVRDLDSAQVASALSREGLTLRISPFAVRVRCDIPQVALGIVACYADYELVSEDEFVDFHVNLFPPRGLRRWVRKQAVFQLDTRQPFYPLPYEEALPFLEWGLNWCIAQTTQHYIVVHSAVVERGGFAALLPGPAGTGKSTLCAGLVMSGWRLLSDELALIEAETGWVTPIPRPISLKNESIDLIRRLYPEAVFGPVTPDTRKGRLAHLRPPKESVARAGELARLRWIVLPRYQPGSRAEFSPCPRGPAFMRLAGDAFNYSSLGEFAFRDLVQTVDRCECLNFQYGDLEDAASCFERVLMDCA
jgi:HprK-related kinase A